MTSEGAALSRTAFAFRHAGWVIWRCSTARAIAEIAYPRFLRAVVVEPATRQLDNAGDPSNHATSLERVPPPHEAPTACGPWSFTAPAGSRDINPLSRLTSVVPWDRCGRCHPIEADR